MGTPEDHADRTERLIQEGEARIARVAPMVERLEEAGHGWAAAEARRVLANFEAALALARDRLRSQRALSAGRRPPIPN